MTRIAYAAVLALSGAILVSAAPPATAQTYNVLFNFHNRPLSEPQGRIYIHGSLFGTGGAYDAGGPPYGNGQVFELTKSNGTWNSTAILKFDGTNGANPLAGLIADASGSLYGTSANGDTYDYGNVFKLTKSGSSWIRSTLWAFGGKGDGQTPDCDLVMDKAGNIYGTTYYGGAYGLGTAFELSNVNGNWTESFLYSFGNGTDGAVPQSGLTLDKSGALYGATYGGGTYDGGTVFELKKINGVWNESVLYALTNGSDGAFPLGVLIEDSSGNLYGTTVGCNGDTNSSGTVFELSQSGGVWTEQTLYSFTAGADGGCPAAGLQWDGNYSTLVGTAQYYGANDQGTVFKLSKSGGVWSETTLHTFGSVHNDGLAPEGQIVRDSHGNLYGTTEFGGTYGNGTVWQITP